jgi:molybdenum cofactor cytidylyltransferase
MNAEPQAPATGVIVLAAGSGSRMGTTKQLLPFRGQPLVRHAVRIALASSARPVVVVVGHAATEIRAALEGEPVEVVENPDWRDGMGTSIRRGIAALADRGLDAAILMLADQPLLTGAILDRLAAVRAASRAPVVASSYAGTVGVPVLFGRERFARLSALENGEGCKGCIVEEGPDAVRIPCPEAEADVDTPEDYGRLGNPV